MIRLKTKRLNSKGFPLDNATKQHVTSYYGDLPREGRLPGRCSMSVPPALEGKRVLDVMCRKGKGAYELSDHTGEKGFVLGVDPDRRNIERAALSAADNHWSGNSWQRYLRFACACPEDLSEAGVRDASFDVVYVNSVLNVAFDVRLALAEFFRCLVPGGYVWVAQGIFAEGGGRLPARAESGGHGNVFRSAVGMDEFTQLCLQAGFSSVEFEHISPIVPTGDDALPQGYATSFLIADAKVIA